MYWRNTAVHRRGATAAVVPLMLALAGCPGSSSPAVGAADSAGGSDTSGLPGSKRLSDLTASERQQYCRWRISHYLAPGHTFNGCPGQPLSTPKSFDEVVAACVALPIPACELTVATVERCRLLMGFDPCDSTDPRGIADCAASIACTGGYVP